MLLTKITKKEVKFVWDDSYEEAFIEWKKRLTTTLILTVPNSDVSCMVYIDASRTNLDFDAKWKGSGLCFSLVEGT